jgi:hypothetical protein
MKVNSQIRNLKKSLNVHVEPSSYQPDQNFLLSKWKHCLNFIEEILKGKTNLCFQELYQTVNDLIIFEIPQQVIENFESIIKLKADDTISQLIQCSSNHNNFEFFSQFNIIWSKITQSFSFLQKSLSKFERKYFTGQVNISHNSIWGLYLSLLLRNLLNNTDLLHNLQNRILYMITDYREKVYIFKTEGHTDDLLQIKNLISLFWDTNLYKTCFDENYLKSSKDFFEKIIKDFDQDLEEYISFIEKALDIESKIITTHLKEFTHRKMILSLENQLLIEKKNSILKRLFSNDENQLINTFLNVHRINFMRRIYLLFKRVKIDEDLKDSFNLFLEQNSQRIFLKFSSDKSVNNFFENLKNLKMKIDEVMKESFFNDEKFKSIAKEGFVKTLNFKSNSVADNLSRYIDHILTESDVENKKVLSKIDDFISIFRYLDAKDLFETFFIKKLAIRLLYSLSNSIKGEKYLIERLRNECGSVFVTKSEEMLSDMDNSTQLTINFDSIETHRPFEINFYVLSSFSWPVTKIFQGNVDDNISLIHQKLTVFYRQKQQGKSLNWHLPWCSGDLMFIEKNILLQVNGIQAGILLKFTKKNKIMSFNKLLELTCVDKDELINNLNILTNVFKIMQVNSEKNYSINQTFTSNKKKVIINHYEEEEVAREEIQEVEERNWEDRKHVVDAYLMKTLKLKKQMNSADLICCILKLIKFPCEISLVQSRIVNLVSNGYLNRDEKDEEIIKYNP